MGIVGLDYCGSTLVSNVLSTLPGVLNVGESHWIKDRNLGCRECHNRTCPVFTSSMLRELREADLSKQSWWEIISKHSDADLILSSDKLPKHYELFGVPDYLLLLYKDPKANIVSWCKRKFNHSPESSKIFSEGEVDIGIKWWTKMTRQLTDWLGHQNREISILSLEDFAKDPKGSTLSLCGWIGIEFDHTSINYWDRDLHYIGGNHSVKRLDPNRHFYRRITVDERWRNHLSEQSIDKIDNNEEITRLLGVISDLSSRGRSSFFRLP